MTGQAPKKTSRAQLLTEAVRKLHAEGLGRNEIARRLGCAAGTVTRAAELAGVSFDRAPVQATAAAQMDAATRRARLADGWHAVTALAVHQLIQALRDERIEGRHLATVAAIGTDKVLRLEPELDELAESEIETRAALTELMGAIRGSVVDARQVGLSAVPPGADPACVGLPTFSDIEDYPA
ncbi:hypothetical protein [Rhodococcus sp. YH1]|uniref:hypothetical protein n=1 Tax=Rhodococcus sp. YH1 TaxID=89066 RepID=UPI0013867E52|nr:hypothetical protein [Rhodococcus sp. YH1]NCL78916.1 hypothetical protein [Rhodococcus sp. YH1]